MAKRPTLQPIPVQSDNPYASGNLQSSLDTLASQYSAAARPGFASRHPFITGIVGGIAAGPAGAITLPMGLQKRDDERISRLAAQYKNIVDAMTTSSKALDESSVGRAKGAFASNVLQSEGIQSPLDQGAFIDSDTMKAMTEGGLAGITGDEQRQKLMDTQKQAFNAVRGELGTGISPYSTKPAVQAPNAPSINPGQTQDIQVDPGTPEPAPVLQGQIGATGPAPPPPPLAPYHYRNPDLVKQGLNETAGIMNNVVSNADDLAKLPFEAEKLQQEAIKAAAEGRSADALALLRQAQTITERVRPNLINAQANQANSQAAFNARRYAGGPAPKSLNEAEMFWNNATPEQKAAWLQNKAQYSDKPPSSGSAKAKAGTSSAVVGGYKFTF